MSSKPSFISWSEKLQQGQPEVASVLLKVAAGAVTVLTPSVDVGAIFGVAANLGRSSAAVLQAEVNAALSDGQATALSATSTAEVDCATYFATTPMGVDSIGIVLPMSGNVRSVAMLEVKINAVTTFLYPAAALSATLATNGLIVTPLGNLVARVVATGLDAASGPIEVKFHFQSK